MQSRRETKKTPTPTHTSAQEKHRNKDMLHGHPGAVVARSMEWQFEHFIENVQKREKKTLQTVKPEQSRVEVLFDGKKKKEDTKVKATPKDGNRTVKEKPGCRNGYNTKENKNAKR